MPPIKRNQKPAVAPSSRRLAGHAGPGRVGSSDASVGSVGASVTSPRGSGVDDDETRSSSSPERGEPARRRPLGRPLAYAALAAGLVAGISGGGGLLYLALSDGAEPSNEAFVDQTATDEVLTAASTNVQRLVSIDHETLDEYHASLGEFLTPNLVEDLDENWPTLRDSYEQSATTVDAQVREAGLAYLEGDRAEVLLVQDVSMERDGAAAGSTSGTYLVGLDKVDGVWKLSRIPDLPS